MATDIEKFISEECPCIAQKRPHRHLEAELQSIHATAPLELVTIDYLKLEKGSNGNQYILLIVDHFTRYVQGFATKNKSGTTAARKLYGDFVLRFGFPSQILHDQGREFENNLFAELEKLSGVHKLRTTPYHPQTNGTVERMNQTVLSMLRTLPENNKSRWPESLDKLIYAYNCTTHDTTGFEPYYLLFGRRPKLPIDLMLGEDDGELVSHEEYAKRWEKQMREAYRIVAEKSAARKTKDTERRKSDSKKLLQELHVGDRVLVKNVREKGGPGKLRSYWEQKVYVISEKKGDVVYSVLGEGEKDPKKIRTVHRNMLLPVSQWFQLEKVKKVSAKSSSRSKFKEEKADKIESHNVETNNSEEDFDGEDEEWIPVYPNLREPTVFNLPFQQMDEEPGFVDPLMEEMEGENVDEGSEYETESEEEETDDEETSDSVDPADETVEYAEEDALANLELPELLITDEPEPPETEDPDESMETLPYDDSEALEFHVEGEREEFNTAPEMEETCGRGMRTKVPRRVTTYSKLGVPTEETVGIVEVEQKTAGVTSHAETVGVVGDVYQNQSSQGSYYDASQDYSYFPQYLTETYPPYMTQTYPPHMTQTYPQYITETYPQYITATYPQNVTETYPQYAAQTHYSRDITPVTYQQNTTQPQTIPVLRPEPYLGPTPW